jgi:hypothetical protein
MAKTDFDDFVKRQQELSAAAEEEISFDPEKELKHWLGQLNSLYSEVQKYLKDYISEGSISIRTENIELNEEFNRDSWLTIGRSLAVVRHRSS